MTEPDSIGDMTLTTSDARRAYTEAFLSELQRLFETDTDWNRGMQWVAGRALTDDIAVVLYRDHAAGAVLGRRYVLSDERRSFSENSAVEVAGEAWTGDLIDPSGPGRTLSVDWADGLCERPGDVQWIGVSET